MAQVARTHQSKLRGSIKWGHKRGYSSVCYCCYSDYLHYWATFPVTGIILAHQQPGIGCAINKERGPGQEMSSCSSVFLVSWPIYGRESDSFVCLLSFFSSRRHRRLLSLCDVCRFFCSCRRERNKKGKIPLPFSPQFRPEGKRQAAAAPFDAKTATCDPKPPIVLAGRKRLETRPTRTVTRGLLIDGSKCQTRNQMKIVISLEISAQIVIFVVLTVKEGGGKIGAVFEAKSSSTADSFRPNCHDPRSGQCFLFGRC